MGRRGEREGLVGEIEAGGERQNDELEELKCDEECRDEDFIAEIARAYIARSVQAKGIYEIWGHTDAAGRKLEGLSPAFAARAPPPAEQLDATNTVSALPSQYADLHASTLINSAHRWQRYRTDSTLKFKLSVDSFNHTRSAGEQREIIDSFAYLHFAGLVRMKDATQEWVVFEEWFGPPSRATPFPSGPVQGSTSSSAAAGHGTATAAEQSGALEESQEYPNTYRSLGQLFFTRAISTKTLRPLIEKHDLKKRPYISTTSMDAELALVTANLALAGPGKIFLDPFCGTGGFLIAAAELGAWVLGSDIDGRSFKGKGGVGLERGVGRNAAKYGLQGRIGGCLTSDLINTPLMSCGIAAQYGRRWLDGIIADPPYGVREGLKVLGTRKPANGLRTNSEQMERKPHLIDGVPAHLLPGYVAPKRPYSFERMLNDILDIAAKTLVDGGRLAFWMPSANENEQGAEEVTRIPQHPGLELLHVCLQQFNRWSRRLLVYQRKPGEFDHSAPVDSASQMSLNDGRRADDLNHFRKRYFEAFAVRGQPQADG